MTHDEVQELLGAYALDAVEGSEADEVELHLRSCPRCRAEVETHRETATWLAQSGAPAPEGVWERIAGSLEDEPPPLDMPRILSWEQRPVRRARRAYPAVAGVAAVLVLLLGLVAVNQQRRIDQIEDRTGVEQALAAALRHPQARQVTLQPPTGAGPSVQAVLLPDGSGYLVADSLEARDASRTYQLWGVSDAKVVSLGVLGNRPVTVAFRAGADVRTLAITEEEAGGVVASKNQPVVAGQVPVTA